MAMRKREKIRNLRRVNSGVEVAAEEEEDDEGEGGSLTEWSSETEVVFSLFEVGGGEEEVEGEGRSGPDSASEFKTSAIAFQLLESNLFCLQFTVFSSRSLCWYIELRTEKTIL